VDKDKFKIRKIRGSDIEFITSTWLKNYRSRSKFAKSMRRDVFMQEHHALIKDLVSNCRVIIACNKEDQDHILSYLIADKKKEEFHFVYTKGAFRKFGIATMLVDEIRESSSCTVTHENMENFFRRFYSEVTYNPYKFFKGN